MKEFRFQYNVDSFWYPVQILACMLTMSTLLTNAVIEFTILSPLNDWTTYR